MAYVERENGKTAETVLKEAGFAVSQRCRCRPSCFDFAARKDRTLLLVKVQSDIGNVSSSDSLELRVISECVSATSLMISEKSREKPLEDDTVYSRYDIFSITQRTFENIVLRKVYPLIQAGPGGYYVEIDGVTIKRRRQELGLSVGELAEMMGTSRRTIYGYERGMTKASVSAAYNLICILGMPVAKPIDVFRKPKDQSKSFFITARSAIIRNKLVQKIFRKLGCYNITAFKKAPFDFVINIKEEKMRIIGGIADKGERELTRRVAEILSISRVVRARPILMTEDRKQLSKDILCLHCKELSEIRDPEELIARFK